MPPSRRTASSDPARQQGTASVRTPGHEWGGGKGRSADNIEVVGEPSKAFSRKSVAQTDSKPSPAISSPIAIPNRTRWTPASDASRALPVIKAADQVNRALRRPKPTPEETVKYLFRLLTLARATTSDALIWRPRAPILDAFFQTLGVSAERMQEQGQER